MKKLLVLLLIVPGLLFAQLSPRNPSTIQNATTAFGVNVPEGSLVYDVSANKYYYCIGNTTYTSTLTTGSANFVEISAAVIQWITNGTKVYYNTGNVGIGTSNPSFRLSMGNDANGVLGVESSGAGVAGKNLSMIAGSTISGTDINGGDVIIQTGLGTGAGTNNIIFKTAWTSGGMGSGTTLQTLYTRATFLGNGYFGLNTTLPSSLLTLSCPTQNTNAIQLFSNSATAEDYVGIGSYYASGTTSVNAQIRFVNEQTSGQPAALAFATGLTTSAIEAMRITSARRVGIGTTAPLSKLQVRGSLSIDTSMALYLYSSMYSFYPKVFEIDGLLKNESRISSAVRFKSNVYNYFRESYRISERGNVLIGDTTDNGKKLYVKGTAEVDGRILANRGLYASAPYALPQHIYCLGNSLTWSSGTERYEYTLGELLEASYPGKWKTVGLGIPGDNTGGMIPRLTNEVLEPGDAAYVIIWGGVNDLIGGITAKTIKDNLQAMYTAAYNDSIRVIAVTITPFKGYSAWTSGLQSKLDSVNTWIRTTPSGVDTFIESYILLEDESNPDQLAAAYDGGDHLHLSTAGYDAVATYIKANVTWRDLTAPKYAVYANGNILGSTLYLSGRILPTITNNEYIGEVGKIWKGLYIGYGEFSNYINAPYVGQSVGFDSVYVRDNITGTIKTAHKSTLGPWITNGTSIYYNTGNVGIGITNPSYKLHLEADAGINGAFDTYHASAKSSIFCRRARGTKASPTKVISGDQLGAFTFFGAYGAGAAGFASGGQAGLFAKAEEDFSGATNLGTKFTFETTATASGTRTEKMVLTGGGRLGIGIANPHQTTENYGTFQSTNGLVELNDSSNFDVNIATGTSTGSVIIGGTGNQLINIGSNASGTKAINIGNTVNGTGVNIKSSTSSVRINESCATSTTYIATGTTTGNVIIGNTTSGMIVDVVSALPGINIPAFARLTGTVTTTGSTLTDITGLTMTLVANAVYEYEANLLVGCNAIDGNQYGVNFNAAGSATYFTYTGTYQINVGATGTVNTVNGATGTMVAIASTTTAGILIKGIITTGANPGTMAIRHKKVTSGGTSSVYTGSFLKVTRIS